MSDPSWVMFDSGLGMTSGKVLGHDGIADEVRVTLTDFVDQNGAGRDRIRDIFAQYTDAVTEALGEPTSRLPGNMPEVRWAGPDTTLFLRALSATVSLHLSTNTSLELQDMAAETDEDDELDSDIWGSP
jgi:predicted ATPase